MIQIINPGIYTTVQDLGRYGFQEYGMPVSGAIDWFSHKLANKMLGNDVNAATLEAHYIGLEFEVLNKTYMAIAGGKTTVFINEKEYNTSKAHQLNKGDIVRIGNITRGFRIYIAFAGGIDVPVIMNSRSTYLRAKIGGYKGRILKAGDKINIYSPNHKIKISNVSKDMMLHWESHQTIRVTASTDIECFTLEGVRTFLTSEYTISNQSDRMGYRLEGPLIEHNRTADIISSGICNGAIQVPGNGNPIIMLADRQTIGGYSKIGNVITADLPVLGQLKPGDKINFKQVRLDEAHLILKKMEDKLNLLGT